MILSQPDRISTPSLVLELPQRGLPALAFHPRSRQQDRQNQVQRRGRPKQQPDVCADGAGNNEECRREPAQRGERDQSLGLADFRIARPLFAEAIRLSATARC
jgi:hypothetical protein